jgi:hypothetical protein
MKRRDVLTAGAVTLVAPLAPMAALAVTAVPAVASDESEIISLYHQYMAITEEAAVHPSMDDDELDRLFYNRRDVIEGELLSLACTGPGDFAAKMIVASCRGGIELDWEKHPVWAEARTLVGA